MKTRIVCSALVALVTVCLAGTSAAAKHPVTLTDLEDLKAVTDLQLSPDGKMIAYTIGGPLHGTQIWITGTKAGSKPREIVSGDFPHWSPDGHLLAFYCKESTGLQLCLFDVREGSSHPITKLANGIDPDPWTQTGWMNDAFTYSWSPDGSRLVFGSRVYGRPAPYPTDPEADESFRGATAPLILTLNTPTTWTLSGIFTHGFGALQYKNGKRSFDSSTRTLRPPVSWNQIFIVNVRTHALVQLTHDKSTYFHPDWSPDGKAIVCTSSEGQVMEGGGVQRTNIYSFDVRSGTKVRITSGPGAKWLPSWSPDGQRIAYLNGNRFGKMSVYTISAQGGDAVNMTSEIDRRVLGFRWSPSGTELVFFYQDGVKWPLASVNTSNRHFTIVGGDEIATRSFLTVSRTGMIAWQQSDGRETGLIRAQLAISAAPYTIVNTNPQIDQWQIGDQDIVQWTNTRGDRNEGILILPFGYHSGDNVPLIVDCYPLQASSFKGWAMMGNQGWASRGYAVFWPNPRAPHAWMNSFKSEDYDRAAEGPQGWDVTIDDITSGVDELVRRGIADPKRIGLYGFSNGGGVVNYLVTQTRRFKCAVSVAGALSDWIRPGLLQPFSWIQEYEVGPLNPWDNPESLIRLSAVFHTGNAKTPMLLADGDEDGNFLLDTIEMYNGLRRYGVDVTLLRYPGQQHGFEGWALRDFWKRETEFFDTHLRVGR